MPSSSSSSYFFRHTYTFALALKCYERACRDRTFCVAHDTLTLAKLRRQLPHCPTAPGPTALLKELVHYYSCPGMTQRTRQMGVLMFERLQANPITAVVREEAYCPCCSPTGQKRLNGAQWDGFDALGTTPAADLSAVRLYGDNEEDDPMDVDTILPAIVLATGPPVAFMCEEIYIAHVI